MAKYKDAEALRNALYDADAITFKGLEILDQFPVADVEEVRNGEWAFSRRSETDKFELVKCSNCGHEAYRIAVYVREGNYCPYCGARMKG